MEPDQHASPIKSPKQLIVIVLLAFAVPIALFALLSQLMTSGVPAGQGSEDAITARIKPVGSIVMAEATGPKGNLTGGEVFAQVCKTCHETGLAGAPKAGDKAAWGPRIAQGEKVLLAHALAGFQGKAGVMPAKGGNPDLTDDEVHRAVVYMANLAGAGWKEPLPTAAPAAVAAATPAAPPAAAAVAAVAPAPAPAATMASAGSVEGKKVYDGTCHVCHATGLVGSPKFGDKAAWAPRIATGMATLYNAALHGLRAMPPKGGNANLSDAEVKAAVDYMTAAAK
ncbi:MAG: cytochrome c5 family protein [Betaproteobacteria bacterium]|nr:c-type cytochrome [Betaproteobacteria bacterium]MDE2004357.1 cytochrome c5 family protein [Betaproteobacteria bacterium]MDE2210931.1 cytochrome c5 family protein [Betaproteobacteria bacterium]